VTLRVLGFARSIGPDFPFSFAFSSMGLALLRVDDLQNAIFHDETCLHLLHFLFVL
jgi:hypothetical protein